MAALTPEQLRTRERVEGLIRLMAPALDMVLAVGDRLSRVAEPESNEYYPLPPSRGGRSPIGGDPEALPGSAGPGGGE